MRGPALLGSAVALAALAAAAPGAPDAALPHYTLDDASGEQHHLPKALSEISGLAFTADGRLLAHGDEAAIVWEIDPRTGRPVKRFGLGRSGQVLKGDFEDIQVVDGRVYLVSSAGDIVGGAEGRDGAVVSSASTTEGLAGVCEVEGLAWDPGTRSFLLLCKDVKSRRWRNQVVVLAVSGETWELEPKPRMVISEKDLDRATGAKGFHGTALVRHPRTGTYLLLAGPEHAYAEVDAAGRVLGGGRLDPKRHRQPEGIAIAPDLTLLVSDEGAGKDATLTAYAWHP